MPFENITHPQKRAFLVAYAQCGVVKRAAKAAEVSRESHYDWKAEDSDYARAFDFARLMAADALEDEAVRRAQLGTIEPVYSGGKRIGFKRRFSDRLLAMLLAGRKPEYGRSTIEHQGAVKHEVAIDLSDLDDRDLDELERLLQKTSRGSSEAGTSDAGRDPGGARTPAAEKD